MSLGLSSTINRCARRCRPGRGDHMAGEKTGSEDGKIHKFFTMGCDELVDPCFGKPFPAALSCEHKRSAGCSKICPSKSPEEKHQTSPNVLLWKTNSTLILFSGPDGDQDVQTRRRFGETLPLEPKLTPTESP